MCLSPLQKLCSPFQSIRPQYRNLFAFMPQGQAVLLCVLCCAPIRSEPRGILWHFALVPLWRGETFCSCFTWSRGNIQTLQYRRWPWQRKRQLVKFGFSLTKRQSKQRRMASSLLRPPKFSVPYKSDQKRWLTKPVLYTKRRCSALSDFAYCFAIASVSLIQGKRPSESFI